MKWDEIEVGAALPECVQPALTTEQLVRYAGASGDFNRIHYDEPFARAGGHRSVIAHGMLTMAFLGQLVSRWAGSPTRVVRLSARFRAISYPGDVLTSGGEVAGKSVAGESCAIELKLFVRNQAGALIADGSATVHLDP